MVGRGAALHVVELVIGADLDVDVRLSPRELSRLAIVSAGSRIRPIWTAERSKADAAGPRASGVTADDANSVGSVLRMYATASLPRAVGATRPGSTQESGGESPSTELCGLSWGAAFPLRPQAAPHISQPRACSARTWRTEERRRLSGVGAAHAVSEPRSVHCTPRSAERLKCMR